MTKRPTRQGIRGELDDLRDQTGADPPEVTEVSITHVAIPPVDDDDESDDEPARVTRRSRTEFEPDTAEWSGDVKTYDYGGE